MSAPTFGSIRAVDTGTSTSTRSPAIPTGVVNGSLAFVVLTVTTNVTPSTPTGGTGTFAVKASTGTVPTHRVSWERAAGSESGTYSVNPNASPGSTHDAQAFRIAGADAGADPFPQAASVANATSTTTSPAVSLTGVLNESMLIWIVTLSNSRNFTPPDGTWTRQTAASSIRVHIFTKISSGGSTGSIQGTSDLTGVNHSASLMELKGISGSAIRFKDSSGSIVTPTVRYKDTAGSVVTPTVAYKDTAGTVTTL